MFFRRYQMIAPVGITPERISAAKSKLTRRKNAARQRNDEVALFPELQATVPESDPATEIEEQDRRLVEYQLKERIDLAKRWRVARAKYFSQSPEMRGRIIRHWNRGIYPGEPGYFVGVMHSIVTGQFDPEEHERRCETARQRGQDPAWKEKLNRALEEIKEANERKARKEMSDDDKAAMKDFQLQSDL